MGDFLRFLNIQTAPNRAKRLIQAFIQDFASKSEYFFILIQENKWTLVQVVDFY